MIQTEDVRARIVRALRIVDDVYIAVEQGPGINESFDQIRAAYPDTELEFCNGGDRRNVDELPADEVEAGARNNISMIYGIGGTDKADSSTRILSDMEA